MKLYLKDKNAKYIDEHFDELKDYIAEYINNLKDFNIFSILVAYGLNICYEFNIHYAEWEETNLVPYLLFEYPKD